MVRVCGAGDRAERVGAHVDDGLVIAGDELLPLELGERELLDGRRGRLRLRPRARP